MTFKSLVVLPVMVAVLLALACGQAGPAPSALGEGAAAELAKQVELKKQLECTLGQEHWRSPGPPKRGGSMTGSISDFTHRDVTGRFTGGGIGSQGQIYNQLLEGRGCFYEDFVYKPSLAKGWETSPDGLTWTFKLRDDVKWQNLSPVNGRKFTSADVAWVANYHIQQKTLWRSYFADVAIETPEAYTVVMKLKAPDPDFLSKCCRRDVMMVAHEVFERDGDFKSVSVGTGAWIISDVKLNQSYTTKPNPDYYEMGLDGKPLPYLNEVRYIFFADNAAELAALRAGKLDMLRATGIEAQDVPGMLQCCPKTRYTIQNRYSNSSLWFNLNNPPWNDPRVRRAARMAISRDDLISSYQDMAGHAGYMPPAFVQYLPPVEKLKELWKQDVEGALKLMKEAGYGPGNRIKTNLKVGGFYVKQAEVVQQHLVAIGIDATIEQTGSGGTDFLNEHYKNPGTYGLELGWGNYGSVEAPGFWMGEIIRTGSSQNKMHLSDPELDRLAAAQAKEVDQEKRAELFRQIQDRMYELTPWVPTVSNYYHRFTPCRIRNVPLMQDNHNAYNVVVAWIDETGC